ncbi:hypothetical protein Daus18300_000221 [Diaporthe australafricana]|uniref:Zn(2)-C6 fungal-type domain-containing protein n=1 Tax=Diaporthe australafricana TaxID=127596 RepID=A0ABR3Y4C6_9PEZI
MWRRSSDADGEIVPSEIHGFIEQYPKDDECFFQQFVHFPDDEPAYVQQSVDGGDDASTYLGSESQVPPLTIGPTLSPSSHSRASPSTSSRPEDADLQAILSVSWPGEGFGDLDSTLRHVGENPAIFVQGPMSPAPVRLQDDDVSIHLSPPGSSGPTVAPVSPPVQAVPMKRGRSNPLPRKKRAKVSNMRKIKACMRCHIRKRECDDGAPCKHCGKAFPKYPDILLVWAERQLSKELDAKKTPGFEAAILSFLLAYRDSPVNLSGASSAIGNKKAPAFTDPKRLVRKTCEMRCWYRIWQTSILYSCAHEEGSTASSRNEAHTELPAAALRELKKLATNALIACEKEILLELDELSPSMAPLIELSHWACIWQVILIYRQLVAGYSNLARRQPMNSMYGVSTGE